MDQEVTMEREQSFNVCLTAYNCLEAVKTNGLKHGFCSSLIQNG